MSSCTLFVCTEDRGDRDAGKRKDRDYKETEHDSKRRARDNEQVSDRRKARDKDRDTRDGRGRSRDQDRKHRSGDADRERHSSQAPDPRSGDKQSQRKDASSGRYMLLTYSPQSCIEAFLEPISRLKGFCERSSFHLSNIAFAQAEGIDPCCWFGSGHCSEAVNALSHCICLTFWELDLSPFSFRSAADLYDSSAVSWYLSVLRSDSKGLESRKRHSKAGLLSCTCWLFRQILLSAQGMAACVCVAACCLAGMIFL